MTFVNFNSIETAFKKIIEKYGFKFIDNIKNLPCHMKYMEENDFCFFVKIEKEIDSIDGKKEKLIMKYEFRNITDIYKKSSTIMGYSYSSGGGYGYDIHEHSLEADIEQVIRRSLISHNLLSEQELNLFLDVGKAKIEQLNIFDFIEGDNLYERV